MLSSEIYGCVMTSILNTLFVGSLLASANLIVQRGNTEKIKGILGVQSQQNA